MTQPQRFDADAMLDKIYEKRMPIAIFLDALAVDPRTFGCWLTGEKQPRRVAATAAAHILGCPVSALYTDA